MRESSRTMRVLTVLAIFQSASSSQQPISDFLPDGYDQYKRPSFGFERADVCNVTIAIYKLGPISESDMVMTADLYVRLEWTDHRLNESSAELINATKHHDPKRGFISLVGADADKVWRPRFYFKDAVAEETPGTVSSSEFLRLHRGGTFLSSKRVILTSRCDVDLAFFPMDVQVCDICIESYQYDDEEQLIAWSSSETTLLTPNTAKFSVNPVVVHYSRKTHWDDLEADYTTLCMSVRLTRKLTMYLVNMYLPSMALVVLSWVSFWIDKSAVPARAGLTITTILAQITLITGTANQFPGISDLKMGDVYMIVNFFFVFGSLIEFAIITGEKPAARRVSSAGVPLKIKGGSSDSPSLLVKCRPRNVDDCAKICFPAAFTLWNICYFGVAFGLRRAS